jgi:hypothetical protein
MNSSNNISDLISQNIEPSSSSFSSTSLNSNSIISYITSINWTTWLIIILILAFLGFNIFAYLAKGTQDITDIFAPLLKKFFGITLAVTGEIVDTSAEGAKAIVDKTASTIDTGLTAVQNITPNISNSNLKSSSITQPPNNTSNDSLNKALHDNQPNNDYQANEAESSVNHSGKSGWCYIGSDRGFRSCAQVGINDTCMSGDIFPSKEICINPNLRP